MTDLPAVLSDENLMRIPRKSNFPSLDLIYSRYLVQITISNRHQFIINGEIAQLILLLNLSVKWTILFIVPRNMLQGFKLQRVVKTARPVYKSNINNFMARQSEMESLDTAEALKNRAFALANDFPQMILGVEC